MKKRRLPRGIPLVLMVVLLVLLAAPTRESLLAGGAVLLVGVLIRSWAAGHLQRNEELATTGPYAHVRDPLYLGRLFILVGLCVMAWSWALLLLPVGLGVFFFDYMPRKKSKEMARLEKHFGEAYTHYAGEVRALVPRLRRYSRMGTHRWNFMLFLTENREPWLMLALAGVIAGLVTRHLSVWSPPW